MAKWSSFSKMDQHGHSQDQESFQYVFFKSSADGGKILSTAQCVLCKVYFSAQPNKLRPILKLKKILSYRTYICPSLFERAENTLF